MAASATGLQGTPSSARMQVSAWGLMPCSVFVMQDNKATALLASGESTDSVNLFPESHDGLLSEGTCH